MSLGKSSQLTRFLRSVRSQVLSSHRTTQPCLVLSCSWNFARPPIVGSITGRRRNSLLVDEGCRVTFADRLARRHSLLRVRLRLLQPGLYPASCLCSARNERELLDDRRSDCCDGELMMLECTRSTQMDRSARRFFIVIDSSIVKVCATPHVIEYEHAMD